MKRLLLITTMLFLFSISKVYSYSFTVEGTITDDVYDQPVTNHYIYFFFNEKGFSQTAITDKNGFYRATFEIQEGTSDRIIVGTHGSCGDEIWDLIFNNAMSFEGTAEINFRICYSLPPSGCKAEYAFLADNDNGATFISTSTDSLKINFWSFGDGTYNFSPNPYHKYSESGYYEVCLTIERIDNCKDTYCKKITVKQTQEISGRVFAGDTTIMSGAVFLYKKNKESFSENSNSKLALRGEYIFSGVEAGEYLVYAIPHFDVKTHYYPKYIPSYYGTTYRWQDAAVKKDDSHQTTIDIDLVSYEDIFYGNCSIQGILKEDQSYSSDVEVPIILLNSEKVPMDFRIPDPETGEYSFKELPVGVYFLHPEKAGVVSSLIKVVLSKDKCEVVSPSFIINSEKISVGINSIEPLSNYSNIRIQPNPATDFINIPQTDDNLKGFKIFDISGKFIYSESIINHNISTINISNLNSGTYFIQLEGGDGFSYGKFIKK